jgi:hypothetical protein
LLEKCNRLILDRQVVHDVGERLEKRLGQLDARLRLGIEADHETQVFGQGIKPKHLNADGSNLALATARARLRYFPRSQSIE